MDLKDVQQLMTHMAWADALAWRGVLACPPAHDDARVHGLLFHMHLVQGAYVTIWRRQTFVIPKAEQFPGLGDLYSWGRTQHEDVSAYLNALVPDALDRHVAFPWAAELDQQYGHAYSATLAESFLQVALHSTHHRAQVLTRLRELGAKPPLVDFIAWIWTGKPVADWRALRMRT
ncbi:MAG: DinB family protein [Longimicrobiales bacterium]